jgi:hypothetical protein
MLATPSPTTASDPSYSMSPVALPANFTMLDLELLHFWTTQSIASFVDFPSCINLFQTTVVELGFSHPFLMHEILSLAALHLSNLRPDKASIYRHASDTHFATGLSLFQPAIRNLSDENCHACYAFSTMVFTHAWASQDPDKPSAIFFVPSSSTPQDLDVVHVQWVKLHRGSHEILQKRSALLREGPLEPLFTPWKGLDRNGPHPLPTVEEEQLSALSALAAASSLSAEQKLTLNEMLQKVRRVFSILAYNPKISQLSAVMSWFSMLSEDYLKMLEEKIPEALLIVVFYCVALKRAEHMWWVKGKGENLLRTVMGELGSGWETWTDWPVEQVLGVGGERRFFGIEK